MKILRNFLLFTSSLFSVYTSSSQTSQQLLDKARRFYKLGEIYEAKHYYYKVLAVDSNQADACDELAGLLFFELNDYDLSYPLITKTLRLKKDTFPNYYYCLGKCQHYRGNVAEAENYYRKFLKSSESQSKTFKDLRLETQTQINNLEYQKTHPQELNTARLRMVNLGRLINTEFPDYVPVVNENESALMFTSRRKNMYNKFIDENEARYHEDIYIAKKDGIHFSSPQLMPSFYNETANIKNSPRYESVISLSPDGNLLFLFKQGQIYKSHLKNGQWTEPELLDKPLLTGEYENHASITADGKVIYFTSDDRNSFGGLDIYRSVKKEDGSWNNPENIGKKINTSEDEEAPYITPDGKFLFFSSRGHEGFGDYDIYKSEWNGTEFSKPVNLGVPFNSPGADIFFYPHKDLKEGYLSSNRKGGAGDLDIYRFYYVDPGFNRKNNKESQSQWEEEASALKNMIENSDPAHSIFAKLHDEKSIEDIFFMIDSGMVTDDPELADSILRLGNKHHLQIEVLKKCDTCIYKQSYFVTVSVDKSKGVAANTSNTNDKEKPKEIENTSQNITKENSVLDEQLVFNFNYNSTKVSVKNNSALKIQIKKWNESKQKIIITGHADQRGSEEVNYEIGLRRAGALKNYLISLGLSQSLIMDVQSKGEKEPLVNCGESGNEAEQAKNRRAEIKMQN